MKYEARAISAMNTSDIGGMPSDQTNKQTDSSGRNPRPLPVLALHPLPLGCNESHRLLACRERAAACAAAGAGFCDLHGRRVRCAVRACAVRALCPQPADCWPFLATSVRHWVATWCTVLQRGALCCNVVYCDATAQSVRKQCRPPATFVCRRTAARRLRSCEHCHRLSLLHTDSQNVR